MSDVLLTGGGGFLGGHLLRELLAGGARVRVLSRREASDQRLRALVADPVRGDMNNLESLRSAVRGVGTVFHCAADTSTWRANNAAQTRTNVGGTHALLAASASEGISAFVHTSSVSAYSHLVHGTLREDVVERGGASWINYERTKFLGEEAVRGSGLPFIIFQPAHILGPGDTHNWSRLIRLVDTGKLPGVPPGSGSFADVREVAKAHVRGWQRQRLGETYLLGGAQASFLEMITMMGKLLDRATPSRATPAWQLKLVAQAMQLVSQVTRKAPEITPEAAQFTCHDLRVDSSKAIAQLDYRQTALHELLADTIAWMRSTAMLGPSLVGRRPKGL